MDAFNEIEALALQIPEIEAWPEIQEVWQQYAQKSVSWRLPRLAVQSIGGDLQSVLPVIAAIGCAYVSIVLVDDILDDDPKGIYHRLGVGITANMALAFQTAAYRIIHDMPEEADIKNRLLAEMTHLNLETARGQHLDSQNVLTERHYWETVQAKSEPFYGAGFYLGATCAGASHHFSAQLRRFGRLVGKIIQVSDDLADVYQVPACPDWHKGSGNLAILYARLATYPEQPQFEALLTQIDDPQALAAAQQILLKCGAVSYCVYQLLQLAREARQMLNSIDLAQPELLHQFVAERIVHLFELMETNGMPLPEELARELL